MVIFEYRRRQVIFQRCHMSGVRSLLILFLLAAVSCQFQDITMIDDFSVDSPTLVIVIPTNPTFPIYTSNFVTSSTILGNERDMNLSAIGGSTSLVLTATVSQNRFSCANPNNAAGSSLLQYDGTDSSIGLNPSGLFGSPNNDFTYGNAFAFRTFIQADIATHITITVYSGSAANYCNYQVSVPGDGMNHEYIINFSSFSYHGGGCDFTNVGAVEVLVQMNQNVDVIIQFISTYGTYSASTPTRTPSPFASRSRTPSKFISPSRTPSVTNYDYVCCLYFSSTQQYETCLCQMNKYYCPGVIGFTPVGNYTLNSCDNCNINIPY
jgi:hypothetical protein